MTNNSTTTTTTTTTQPTETQKHPPKKDRHEHSHTIGTPARFGHRKDATPTNDNPSKKQIDYCLYGPDRCFYFSERAPIKGWTDIRKKPAVANRRSSIENARARLGPSNFDKRELLKDIGSLTSTRRLAYVPAKPSLRPALRDDDGSGGLDGSDVKQSHVIDLQNLRRLASQGIRDEGSHRAAAWRVLLGYLPQDLTKWEEVLNRDRSLYRNLVGELFVQPDHQSKNNSVREDDDEVPVMAKSPEVVESTRKSVKVIDNLAELQHEMERRTSIKVVEEEEDHDDNFDSLHDDDDILSGNSNKVRMEDNTMGRGEIEVLSVSEKPSINMDTHARASFSVSAICASSNIYNKKEYNQQSQPAQPTIAEDDDNDDDDDNDNNDDDNDDNELTSSDTPLPEPSANEQTDTSQFVIQSDSDEDPDPDTTTAAPSSPAKSSFPVHLPPLQDGISALVPARMRENLKNTQTPIKHSSVNELIVFDDDGFVADGSRKERITVNDNPLNPNKDSKWKQFYENARLLDEIRKDVVRTHPDLHFFLEPENDLGQRRYAALERILFVWAKLNKGVRYVQGMNEIIGTIYFVLATDFNEEWACEAEADAYFLFNTLMVEMRDVFVPDLDEADTGIQGRISNFIALLSLHDPEVRCHLDDIGIDASFYSIRWLTTLLSREFLLPDTIRLWDSMFASTHKDNFLRYVCVTMVMIIREKLLLGDFSTCLRLLQSYPPTNVDRLLESSRALWIYESQITLACHKGGISLQQALQTIQPPPAIIMAYGLVGGVAMDSARRLRQVGEAGINEAKKMVKEDWNNVKIAGKSFFGNVASKGFWGLGGYRGAATEQSGKKLEGGKKLARWRSDEVDVMATGVSVEDNDEKANVSQEEEEKEKKVFQRTKTL